MGARHEPQHLRPPPASQTSTARHGRNRNQTSLNAEPQRARRNEEEKAPFFFPSLIQLWLGPYASRHPETEALANATVILDTENTVQPHALLRRLPEHGGLTRVNEAGYLAGPPELIVEVAASSASIDLRDKRRAYCRNGVREYLVWLVAEARLEWFCLEDDDYRPQLPDAQSVLHSRVFPGLRLPVTPLLAGDTAKVLAALTGPEPLSTKPPETSVKSG
jgi:hypothetical protein